jgi:dipeptidyl aminopeptidase/acylaminoacyl peptidase
VQAIVSYFGASNLTTILSQSTPHGLSVREPALSLLLGALPDSDRELAELASPVFHIDERDPPLFLLHGDQDPQMPINQAHELEGQYKKLGLDVTFETVYGAGHGGEAFFTGEDLAHTLAFLHRTVGTQ